MHEYRERRLPRERKTEFSVEPVERGEPIPLEFVTDIVDQPRLPVDGEQLHTMPRAQQSKCDRKILIACLRDDVVNARTQPGLD